MSEENNNDDGLELDEASFDDFEKKKGTLGDLWRDNAMVKVGVVVAAAAAIFGTIILFGGKSTPVDQSYVPEGSEISAPPGTEEASPAYVDAVEQENEARTEEAQKSGGSSLPTPINPPVGRLTITEDQAPEEDPLQRWRKLQEERLQREMLRTQTATPETTAPEDTQRQEKVQALAEAMTQQMQSILEKNSQPKTPRFKSMTPATWLEQMKQKQAINDQQTAQTQAQIAQQQQEITQVVLYPAGHIAYAQTLIEANSDVPGPVLAQLASGPLSGDRILGSFQKQKELITLNFNNVVHDGVTISVNGIAIDPKTTLPALATDVDHHYLKRVILPMASSFVQGMASAISESGRTDVTVSGETVASQTQAANNDQKVASGIEEAGQKLGEILDDEANKTEVTVRIATGTPIGILFLQSVIKPQDDQLN